MSAPKVAICTPYYRQVEGSMYAAAMAMAWTTAAHVGAVIITTKGAYVEDNRNGCVQCALDTGIPFDYLFWMDSDMIFPRDTLLRLLAHGKDIVGANYRVRTPPYGYAGRYLNGDESKLLVPGLHEMEHLPTGLLLTKFDIYRKMSYPWFKPGTHHEARDDVYFCHEARKLGYQLWCDHDLTFEVGHDGNQTITWFAPDQVRTEIRGAQLSIEDSQNAGRQRAEKAGAAYREGPPRSAA